MPAWDDARLKAAIAGGEIGGITLDTSTFDAAECNLKWRVFESLGQFKGTGVQYVLTDVVVGEVRSHIRKRAQEAATGLRAAAREFAQTWKVDDAVAKIEAAMGANTDPNVAAQAEIDRYVGVTGAEVLGCAGRVDLGEVLDRYFAPRPPFEATGEKKNEFPDALALLALEAWGRSRKQFVLAVSRDSGWKRFAADAEWLVCFDKLRAVLGHFNEEETFLAKRTVARLNDGDATDLSAAVDQVVQRFVDDMYPTIEASSAYWYEVEYEGATLLGRGSIDIDTVDAVASSEETITISFDVEITVEADASFTFCVKDEGEYIPIASASASRTFDITLPMTLEVTREDPPQLVEAETSRDPFMTMGFGDVEPDWREEYDDE